MCAERLTIVIRQRMQQSKQYDCGREREREREREGRGWNPGRRRCQGTGLARLVLPTGGTRQKSPLRSVCHVTHSQPNDNSQLRKAARRKHRLCSGLSECADETGNTLELPRQSEVSEMSTTNPPPRSPSPLSLSHSLLRLLSTSRLLFFPFFLRSYPFGSDGNSINFAVLP
jgi:hypothetical protein